MDVDVATGNRGPAQVNGNQLPDYPGVPVDAMAVHNASGSLEIIGQLALNEWELLRHKIREFGAKIRQLSSKVGAVTVKRLWHQLLYMLQRHSKTIPAQFELDAALILNEMEKAQVERPPPRDTFNDLRRVLLEDRDCEEGVVHSGRAPAWRALPPPRRRPDPASPSRGMEGDASTYQLFNRPMTVDDDFDRLSIPSTNFAHSESDMKIVGLEAQLALLTRQLNMLMTNGVPQTGGGGGNHSQRTSRPVSRCHSRASLYQQQQQMNGGFNGSYGGGSAVLPHHHHHSGRHGHVTQSVPHSPHSPSPISSDENDDGVYMNDDSASSYASPSHTAIPPAPPLPATVLPLASTTAAGIPLPPPLVLQTPSTGLQQLSAGSGDSRSTLIADSPTLVAPYNNDDDDLYSLSPPCSPLPPPPPSLQQLQHPAAAALHRVNTQESTLSSVGSGGRSFLDDINRGNFALRKTSSDKSPMGSRSDTSGDDETEQDENTVRPLVKPTTNQLLSRKDSLRRTSADRSPGGTPQNRSRRRPPSLGQDGGNSLFQGDYLAAALANKFNTIRVNEEDDDQSMTAGDQSWLDE